MRQIVLKEKIIKRNLYNSCKLWKVLRMMKKKFSDDYEMKAFLFFKFFIIIIIIINFFFFLQKQI